MMALIGAPNLYLRDDQGAAKRKCRQTLLLNGHHLGIGTEPEPVFDAGSGRWGRGHP